MRSPISGGGSPGAELSEEAAREIQETAAVPAQVWFAIAAWAKQTSNLQPWQRGIAYTLGQYAGRGRTPSPKQSRQAVKIYAEAQRLGFRADAVAEP